jgi:hypothetical protein
MEEVRGMTNLSYYRTAEDIPQSIVRFFSFGTVYTRGNCAHLMVKDCFECLSPHKLAA